MSRGTVRIDNRAPGPVAVQLRLLPGEWSLDLPGEWSLDEHTRRVGRRGVAQAREILRRSTRSRLAPAE
jgi:hypothetical protein